MSWVGLIFLIPDPQNLLKPDLLQILQKYKTSKDFGELSGGERET